MKLGHWQKFQALHYVLFVTQMVEIELTENGFLDTG